MLNDLTLMEKAHKTSNSNATGLGPCYPGPDGQDID